MKYIFCFPIFIPVINMSVACNANTCTYMCSSFVHCLRKVCAHTGKIHGIFFPDLSSDPVLLHEKSLDAVVKEFKRIFCTKILFADDFTKNSCKRMISLWEMSVFYFSLDLG